MCRACGALLETIVATRAWVPLPIPGSMITDLRTYLDIQPHAPSLYLMHEEATNATTNDIDDNIASMVVAHHVRIHKDDSNGIGCTSYNPGQNIPYILLASNERVN